MKGKRIKAFEMARDEFLSTYGVEINDNAGRRYFDRLENQYGYYEVKIAVEIACEKYLDEITAISKIGGILYNRERKRRIMFDEVYDNE